MDQASCSSPAPRVYPNSCPSNQWCHPTISSSVVPFSSCPESFPASGSFQMNQLFTSDKCKSKPQWGTISHQSEWLSSKSLQAVNAGEGVEKKGTLLHCWWECKLVQPLWRTVWRFLKKTGIRTALWPSNPTAGHTHRRNQNWKRHVYPNVHCSTVYNSQDMETT